MRRIPLRWKVWGGVVAFILICQVPRLYGAGLERLGAPNKSGGVNDDRLGVPALRGPQRLVGETLSDLRWVPAGVRGRPPT